MHTVNKNCTEYYSTDTHKLQPKPDFILVNNEYFFTRAGIRGIEADGEVIPHGQYGMVNKSSYVGAIGLYQLLSRLITVSTVSPHMEIDFLECDRGINKAVEEL